MWLITWVYITIIAIFSPCYNSLLVQFLVAILYKYGAIIKSVGARLQTSEIFQMIAIRKSPLISLCHNFLRWHVTFFILERAFSIAYRQKQWQVQTGIKQRCRLDCVGGFPLFLKPSALCFAPFNLCHRSRNQVTAYLGNPFCRFTPILNGEKFS